MLDFVFSVSAIIVALWLIRVLIKDIEKENGEEQKDYWAHRHND